MLSNIFQRIAWCCSSFIFFFTWLEGRAESQPFATFPAHLHLSKNTASDLAMPLPFTCFSTLGANTPGSTNLCTCRVLKYTSTWSSLLPILILPNLIYSRYLLVYLNNICFSLPAFLLLRTWLCSSDEPWLLCSWDSEVCYEQQLCNQWFTHSSCWVLFGHNGENLLGVCAPQQCPSSLLVTLYNSQVTPGGVFGTLVKRQHCTVESQISLGSLCTTFSTKAPHSKLP